ncbi:FtsX-like permease family protein [Sphingobium sp. AN558]|uniref:ABC transporter permease n=1 Tax=Sphingobium sp. AN558 TaxID=3133442 RepID=UPI0030C0FA36
MSTLPWAQSWRIARRDLHAGFRGLRLLFVCLLLGVGTLAAIGSLTEAITGDLSARGQTLLGGDVEVAMTQREASAAEKQALRRLGRFSESLRTRAMAQRVGGAGDGPAAVLTELKGVDNAYPLYGALTLKEGVYRRPLASDRILIGQALVERLRLRPGDRLRYGQADFTVAGVIADEPDRVGEGFTLGPVAIVSLDGFRRTGLIQPGSLFTAKYRLRLPPGVDAQALRATLEKRHASQGWQYKDRDRAAPGANRFIERMGQFLSLIGLTALVIAGIGVSSGVASYLALKRGGIATLKVLGATAADIERIYLLQIGAVAALAIGCGLFIGALAPSLIIALAGDVLPVQPGLRLHAMPLATSAIYGLLIGYIFTLPPLARARTEPAAAIFRALVDPRHKRDMRTIARVAGAAAVLIALVLLMAREPLFAASVLGATGGVILLLLLLGHLVSRIARRLPRPRRPLLRLALANLHRPGAQTAALVVALGLALTLFVTMAGIQTSLNAEIAHTVPSRAPNLFVLDVPSAQEGRFRDVVDQQAGDAKLNIVPALRGTIVGYAGKRVADMAGTPDGAWVLRGERGVTYSATLPEGSELVAGQWWPAYYNGPPLLSMDADQAGKLGLHVGDSMTVSILGREIEARIASLRKISWDSMGFNYVLVFSPNSLAAAPHSLTATITMPPARDGAVTRALLAVFPGASVIAVGDLIAQVSGLLDQMVSAILAAASITILAGIAVLVGAIAASRQARSYDSVILKTLGATRWQILGAQGIEYGLLAAMLSLVSLALGTLAAWFVIVQLFDFAWSPDWGVVLATLGGGAIVTLGIGLAGSLPLMAVRPARALRQL